MVGYFPKLNFVRVTGDARDIKIGKFGIKENDPRGDAKIWIENFYPSSDSVF